MIKNVLAKVLSGLNDKNIKFNDLKRLILDLDFSERIKGSHHIYFKTGIVEIINLTVFKGWEG